MWRCIVNTNEYEEWDQEIDPTDLAPYFTLHAWRCTMYERDRFGDRRPVGVHFGFYVVYRDFRVTRTNYDSMENAKRGCTVWFQDNREALKKLFKVI